MLFELLELQEIDYVLQSIQRFTRDTPSEVLAEVSIFNEIYGDSKKSSSRSRLAKIVDVQSQCRH